MAQRREHGIAGRVDAMLAAGLFGLALGVLIILPPDGTAHRPVDATAVTLLAVMTGVLLVRHRFPVPVLLVNVAAVFAYQLLDYPAEPVMLPVLVALYTVASTGNLRRTLLVGIGTSTVVIATLVITEPEGYGAELLGAVGWVVVALALGEAVRNHRAYRAAVEDRVARLAAEERLRIAQDVHDVLAHSIAAINVQAGVAAHLIASSPRPDDDPLRAVGGILDSITETSRGGIADLQATLELLRGDAPPARGPVAGLAGIDALTAPVRAGGTEVAVEVTGDAGPVPPTHDVAAYRIVQEALTNAVKHGRAGRVVVTIHYGRHEMRVRVVNAGRGQSAHPPAPTSGYGIAGMTARAHAVGGDLHAGPAPGGGFAVEAVLPLPLAGPATQDGR